MHASNVLGGARLEIGTQHIEPCFIFMHRGDHAASEGLEGFTVLLGAPNDLVVDIGDVAHIGQLVAAMAQPARNHIECHHYPCMPDVAEVIDRHTADVHADLIAG